MAAAKDSKAAGSKAKSGTKTKASTKAGVTKAAPKKGRKTAAATKAEAVEPVVPNDIPSPAARAKKDAVKKAKAKKAETGDPGVAAPASMKKAKGSKEADVPGIKPDVEEEAAAAAKPASTPKSASKKKAATGSTPKKAAATKATPKKEGDAPAAKPAAKKRKASTIEEGEAKVKAAVATAAKKQKISNETAAEAQGILGMVSSGLQAAQKRVSDLFGVLGGSDDGKDTKKKAPKKSSSKAKAATSGEATDGGDSRGVRATADSDDGAIQDDDPAAAFLRGFDSSDEEAASGEEGFAPGKPIPKLPGSKGLAKRLKGAATKEEPGVVYIGRIPHGFHENEMRAYFSQFGAVEHVRLSRSRKTGRSKHYAFLQFASADVARIAAETMNNYLMFGHILKCRVIPPAQVHPNLWIGADKRFKTVPWNKIEGRKLAQPKGASEWDARVEQEQKRRAGKAAKLQAIGYEFEAPTLKRPGDVLQPKVTVEQETTLVTSGNVIASTSTEVKRRPVAADFLPEEPEVVEKAAAKASKATKKAKKAVDALVEEAQEEAAAAVEAAEGKAKKGKGKEKAKGKA